MRFIICLGLLMLVSSCTTSTANYYTQTIHGWRGGNAKNLVQRWGTPDQRMTSPGGNTIYIYNTQSYRNFNAPSSPPVGVNYTSGGRPVIVPMNNSLNNWNRGPMSISCSAIFEANPKGVIINTQIQGTGCYGSENFANTKSNPEMR